MEHLPTTSPNIGQYAILINAVRVGYGLWMLYSPAKLEETSIGIPPVSGKVANGLLVAFAHLSGSAIILVGVFSDARTFAQRDASIKRKKHISHQKKQNKNP